MLKFPNLLSDEEMLDSPSLKKATNPLDPLIQQAKANIAMANKVAAQNPRPMLFGNKKGTQHGFVSVDPSKPNQWRITHFVKGGPSGHTEAVSFSDAIKKAHSSGYDVSKELSEEDMNKTEKHNDLLPLKSGKHPMKGGCLEFAHALKKKLGRGAKLVDVIEPEDEFKSFLLHPGKPHHVVVYHNEMYHDFDGSYTEQELLEKWQNLASNYTTKKLRLEPHNAARAKDNKLKKSEDFSRVSSVIVATDDKMLMLQRRDNNKWTFPGGHLNDTETHLEGAVRELWEEAGIRANPDEMILLDCKKTFQKKDIHVYLYKINSEVQPSASNDPDKEAKKFEWLPHVLPEEIKSNLYIPVGENASLSMFSMWLLRQKTNKLKELIEFKKKN